MDGILESLKAAHSGLRARSAGTGAPLSRQPVHVVYGGAQLFKADTPAKLARLAQQAWREHAPDAAALAGLFGWSDGLARAVYPRIEAKLAHEAVEDLRIDFEDGYGARPDAEEDGHAREAARELALAMERGGLPPFIGIRIKPLSEDSAARALRTLELFVETLLSATGGRLPESFVVTLPKVQHSAQPRALSRALAAAETRHGLAPGALRLELMVETPLSLIGADGRAALPELVAAAEGRCAAAHFGAYDFTAECGVVSAHQRLDHPLCGLARGLMQISLAGTGVALSDGATTLLPVPPHRAPSGGALSPAQAAENRDAIRRAWQLSYRDIRRSLESGIYQGWDLHPAQIPVRYAAVYAFFYESLEDSTRRLRSFVEKAAQATQAGGIFDDAATGQGLLNFFLRGLACGALSEREAAATGLKPEELATRSFQRILLARGQLRA